MRIGPSLALTRLSGGAGAWTPADLPGLAAWYTASPLYCFTDAGASVPCGDGDPIRTWTDRSGNGHTLSQAALAYRPILYSLGGGVYVATFDGIDDYMRVEFTLAAPYTIGYAGGWGTLARTALFDGGGDFTGMAYREDDTFLTVYNGATVGTTFVPAAGAPFALRLTHTGTHIAASVNGTSVMPATANTSPALGGITFCARGLAAGFFAAADMYETVVSSAAASGGDAAALDAYLAAAI